MMILIAFCFFLVLFFIFLIVLSKILGKIGNAFYGEKGRKIGGSILWILLGCFIVYQFIIYCNFKIKVENECKNNSGLFVYVTSEQWKEKNQYEWKTLSPYNNKYGYDLAKTMENININGTLYKPIQVINNRVILLEKNDSINKFTNKGTKLYFDKKENTVLAKWSFISTSGNRIDVAGDHPAYWLTWLGGVKSCTSWSRDFFDLKSEYSNQSLTEQNGGSK